MWNWQSKSGISILSYTILYCTVLYCTALYCTVLHCTGREVLLTWKLDISPLILSSLSMWSMRCRPNAFLALIFCMRERGKGQRTKFLPQLRKCIGSSKCNKSKKKSYTVHSGWAIGRWQNPHCTNSIQCRPHCHSKAKSCSMH